MISEVQPSNSKIKVQKDFTLTAGGVSLETSTTIGGLNSTWGFSGGTESSSIPLSAGASLSMSLLLAAGAFSLTFSFFAS